MACGVSCCTRQIWDANRHVTRRLADPTVASPIHAASLIITSRCSEAGAIGKLKRRAPEAFVLKQAPVGLQHQQLRVRLFLHLSEVTVVEVQPLGRPGGAAGRARPVLRVLCDLRKGDANTDQKLLGLGFGSCSSRHRPLFPASSHVKCTVAPGQLQPPPAAAVR